MQTIAKVPQCLDYKWTDVDECSLLIHKGGVLLKLKSKRRERRTYYIASLINTLKLDNSMLCFFELNEISKILKRYA